MVNWWLGLVFWVSLSNNPFHKGMLGIQTTGPQTINENMCFFWIIELGGGLGFESSHLSN